MDAWKRFTEQESVLAKLTNKRWRVVVNNLADFFLTALSKQSLEKDTMTPESAAQLKGGKFISGFKLVSLA